MLGKKLSVAMQVLKTQVEELHPESFESKDPEEQKHLK